MKFLKVEGISYFYPACRNNITILSIIPTIMKYRKTNVTSKNGINYIRSVVEATSCLFHKIEQENEIRYAEKRKIFFEHLERNSAQKIKREEYLSLFSSLSLLDKLRKVISEDKPLFFFPTDFSDVDQETLSELTKDERVSLYKKILKYSLLTY